MRGDNRLWRWNVSDCRRRDVAIHFATETIRRRRIPASRHRCRSNVAGHACSVQYDRQVPTTLTIADVERIAALAQLELTEEEKQLFTRQLADILHYAEQVQAIDTSGVPPTDHINSAQRTERDDEPRPSLPTEEAIANAPDGAPAAGLFRVPRVLGG
jgi:aspartyl-tRNA(Asn)/glutamyl-tRNA(Gln) amidotransferase subunit C